MASLKYSVACLIWGSVDLESHRFNFLENDAFILGQSSHLMQFTHFCNLFPRKTVILTLLRPLASLSVAPSFP